MPKERVLNISEVRERLREVREAALHRGAVIHWGERGRDELVTLSRYLFQRLIEQPPGASTGKADESAWSAFEAALADGRFSDSGEVGPRRRMPGLSEVSSVDWSDIPSFVGTERPPRRRRARERG